MKYDFTTILDRRGKDSLAADKIPFEGLSVDPDFSTIPMWIADMSFVAAPPVMEALYKRLEMPNFGYFPLPKAYFDRIIRWQRTRNGVEGLLPEHIGYENGVLGGVSAALQAFTTPGEKVLVHSPTYVGFTHTFEDTGRVAVHSPLKRDEAGVWRMDYEDMDAKLKQHHIHVAVFCSPHNPCGRVWERWELEKAMEVYRANDCTVISDEIWSDIILEGHKHIPTQSVSEDARRRTVALYAPSKTFNLAGLVGSYHIIYDPALRDRVRSRAAKSHYNAMNVLSMHALVGAYTPEGEQWVDELCQVITGNIRYACDFIQSRFEGVTVSPAQGTYMLFVDCTDWCAAHGKTIQQVEQACWDVGVAVQDGRMFHGPCHIRMNLALPLSRVQEAFDRLDKYVFNA